MPSRDPSSTADHSDEGPKNAKAIERAVRVAIAACASFALAAPAGAAPHPDPAPYSDPVARYHHHHRHHHRKHTAKHRAHKSDLSGYEFELIAEGTHVLTRDEELGNQAAIEAAEHPDPSVTPREEETPTEPEG
jgi:hypothetical protein